MKKIIAILSICILFCSNPKTPAFSEESDNIETVNIPVSVQSDPQEEEMFAPVDLDLTDYTQMNKQNKRFNVRIEKEEKPVYVKNEGQIWDTDKLYRYNYYANERNLRVIPSYGSINSYLSRDLDANTRVMIGQDGISDVGGASLNFFKVNNSYYAQGARLDHSGEKMSYTIGAFTETDTNDQYMAAAISSKPKHILNSKGAFSFGGGLISNIRSAENKNTAGIFSQYTRGRFSLGTQFAQSTFSEGSKPMSNTMHVMPQFNVNDHLTLKTKFVKDMDIDEVQGEVGIVFKPLKDTDVLTFDVSATNYQSQSIVTRQRLKFSTSFRF